MTRILTVICSGSQCNLDQAAALARELISDGILVAFEDGSDYRPVVVMGEDAIEVACKDSTWNQARATFHSHGFGFPGDE